MAKVESLVPASFCLRIHKNSVMYCRQYITLFKDRNRRASNHRSHLARISLEKLCSQRADMLVYNAKSSSDSADASGDPCEPALTDPVGVSRPQRHPGPEHPRWKIPPSEWPTMLRRVEQGEPLRKLAAEYTVSYETIRRVVRAARKLQAGLGKGWEAALKNE